jgi:basic membrane lipoprotein Med (substrate-binding protein (PBP1-ABC) superfamily)
MFNRKITVLLLILTVLLVGIVPFVAAQGTAGIESVCLVTDLGRVNDGTFNQFAYEGMVRAADEFDLDNRYIETQNETDYRANIDTCVAFGVDAVVTVGFLIADSTWAAAEDNPDVYFIGVDQFVFEGPPNYVGIQYREDQSGFLAGALAAMVTESGVVAGVYGVEIPPVVKFRNGFEQGVAYLNAEDGTDVQTLGVYIDDFLAPDRGASAAEQFIGEGADVIFGAGGPTGTGGILAAAAQGVWVIGVDQDEYISSFGAGETEGSQYIITSAIKRVDQGVYDMLAVLAQGDMESFVGGGNYILEVANDGITFGPKHDADIPDEYYDRLTEIKDGLISGDIETGVDPASGQLLSEMTPEPEATESSGG